MSSSIDISSRSSPGFHPKRARKLITAPGRYPFSRYPLLRSPLTGSVQSSGKTGKPSLSPSRLLSLPFPSGLSNSGRCTHCGMVSLQPNAS